MEELIKRKKQNSSGEDLYELGLHEISKRFANRATVIEFCQEEGFIFKIKVKLGDKFPDFSCYSSSFFFEVIKGNKKVQ